MAIELLSQAEQEAEKAEILAAFAGIKLLNVKQKIAALLGLIGRGGIFDEYTCHDISHIDEMLKSLEWIVPESTKKIMSQTDWLLIVLAIYFHDLGMLVTRDEYSARNSTEFPRYRDEVLFGGAEGADYRARIMSLSPDEADRFMYQEFVRHKHAERIRAWIMGKADEHLGRAHQAMKEISKLLEATGLQFRRDLGLVCESHHLNDLNDLKKYKPSQPYGNSEGETGNIQYCAVLLRTADLLHITSDRTPSITFRVINPTDPISQKEWAKQMAVKRIRPKIGLNDEGLPDESVTKDTIEVHAYFTKEDGFFGLTTFLSYAADQLRKSNEWISTTARMKLAKHEFPWKKIDDSNIETEGFIRDTFEFTIDQARILDLLTGHTLYNDTGVVLRELVQNAIDAVRLQYYPDSPGLEGKVAISWDSQARILSVADNGTGMTQDIITNYLLKVGTSRYQDPEFRKQYPDFSSISRFGIGVLSTFMIADSVEILTCHPEEERARQLVLRSVHGKYLIRLIEKTSPIVGSLLPHGTIFKLRVRPSVEALDVLKTAKRWVVIPECYVTVRIDQSQPEAVGFESTADALADLLKSKGISANITDGTAASLAAEEKSEICIVHRISDGVSIAYAVRWHEYFHEWEFYSPRRLTDSEGDRVLLGTCLEGIRIEFDSPGFEGLPILAIANIKGTNAPKTNVARSGLEATPERDEMLRNIYKLYVDHVAREIVELHEGRSFSLTWAAAEAPFLLGPLVSGRDNRHFRMVSAALFEESVQTISMFLVEKGDRRITLSAKELDMEKELWTIECELFRSAERLIKEAATPASLAQIIKALHNPSFEFQPELVLCGADLRNIFGRLAFRNREVDKIVIHSEQRRVDLRWVEKIAPPRWICLSNEVLEFIERTLVNELHIGFGNRFIGDIAIGSQSIEIQPLVKDIGIRAFRRIYLFPGSNVAKFIKPYMERVNKDKSRENMLAVAFLSLLVEQCIKMGQIKDAEEVVKRLIGRFAVITQ